MPADVRNSCHMLTSRHIATVRNYDIISGKFNIVPMCYINENCA